MPTVMDKAQVVADTFADLEVYVVTLNDPVLSEKTVALHVALDRLRKRFGVPISPEGGAGVIAFSSNTGNKGDGGDDDGGE